MSYSRSCSRFWQGSMVGHRKAHPAGRMFMRDSGEEILPAAHSCASDVSRIKVERTSSQMVWKITLVFKRQVIPAA